MTDKQYDLDLDALAKFKKVKLGGKIIKIQAVDVADLFGLQSLAFKIKNAEGMGDKEVLELYEEFKKKLNELIPEIKGEKLDLRQLFALFEMIADMAIPEDVKELEKKGIKFKTDQKKTPSGSSKK